MHEKKEKVKVWQSLKRGTTDIIKSAPDHGQKFGLILKSVRPQALKVHRYLKKCASERDISKVRPPRSF